jgi:hypothetical protein
VYSGQRYYNDTYFESSDTFFERSEVLKTHFERSSTPAAGSSFNNFLDFLADFKSGTFDNTPSISVNQSCQSNSS